MPTKADTYRDHAIRETSSHGAASHWHCDVLKLYGLPSLPDLRRAMDQKIDGFTFAAPPRRSTVTALLLSFSLLLPFTVNATEPNKAPCAVNVSTCTAQQCAYLPGIGPSKGAAIEAAHPTDEAALGAVPGIGDATLARVRPFVTYQGETTCTSKQATPKPEAGKDGAQ